MIFTDTTPVGVDSATAPFGSYKFDTFAVRPSGATTTAQIFDTSLFKVEFFTAAPPILAGDYNNNDIVDAADYVVWRNNENTNNTLPNDPLGRHHRHRPVRSVEGQLRQDARQRRAARRQRRRARAGTILLALAAAMGSLVHSSPRLTSGDSQIRRRAASIKHFDQPLMVANCVMDDDIA